MMKPEKFPPGSTRQSQRCQIPPEKEELCGAGVKVARVDWKQILEHVGSGRPGRQGRLKIVGNWGRSCYSNTMEAAKCIIVDFITNSGA